MNDPLAAADTASTPPPSAAAGVAPTRAPNAAIVALAFAACGTAAAMRVCDPLLPRIEDEYHVGLAGAAQVITYFAVAYGVLQLVYGPVGDRFGKLRVVFWACVGCAVTSFACALTPDLRSLLAARFLAGATAAAIMPLSMAWIGDVVPYHERQPVLARFLFGNILGFGLGQLLGGISAQYFDVRFPFYVLAVWFAVAVVLLHFGSRTDPQRGLPRAAGPTGTLRGVLRISWARVVLATVFLEGAFLFGALAFAVTHVHRNDGLSITAAGVVLMLFAAGGAAYAGFAGSLVRVLGETGLARMGGVIMLFALATIALATWWPLAALGAVLAGLGFYMLHNTLQTNATQMAPTQRGSAVSSFAASLFIGQSIGVAIAGALAERIGTTAVLLIGGAGVCVIGWTFSRLRAQHAATA
jgi:predicted MFS family arabinose efflux permease